MEFLIDDEPKTIAAEPIERWIRSHRMLSTKPISMEKYYEARNLYFKGSVKKPFHFGHYLLLKNLIDMSGQTSTEDPFLNEYKYVDLDSINKST